MDGFLNSVQRKRESGLSIPSAVRGYLPINDSCALRHFSDFLDMPISPVHRLLWIDKCQITSCSCVPCCSDPTGNQAPHKHLAPPPSWLLDPLPVIRFPPGYSAASGQSETSWPSDVIPAVRYPRVSSASSSLLGVLVTQCAHDHATRSWLRSPGD